MGNWMIYFIALMAILLFQLLFALGLGVITRKVSYTYYAGFLVMMGVYNYSRFYSVHQWPVGPDDILITLAPIYPFFAYFFYFRFVRFFLELKQLVPRLGKLAHWLEWISLSYIPVFFLLIEAPQIRSVIYFFIAGTMAVGTIVLQVGMLRFRLIIVRLVQWGSLFYFLGMMTGFFNKFFFELLDQPEPRITTDYMTLGLLAEITFFSLALAYKLRQEAQEKQLVQQQALEQLQKIQDLNITLQRVRDNVARDLHDDIGSTLGSISLLGAMAEQQIREDHPASALIKRMGEYARSTGESMNDAIWALDSRNDKGEALIKRMRDFAAVLLNSSGLSYHFEYSEAWTKRELPMKLRKDLFLIFKEGIYNIVRHAKASEAHIELGEIKNDLILTMADNGIGIKNENPETGNGLRNMQKRAEESGMKLRLYETQGGGLTIELIIPSPN
ncbi:MAG: hypothetical protein KDE26_08440 [Bacteroidetes bacterium]|nr:hypothetical protein [Bacteroidota bacterium]MCB0843265.1 hypothetical protein [Bacteroidota bacterium]